MAHSFVRYVGDGTTKTFPVPFPFLFPDNIQVVVDAVEVDYVLQHVGEVKVILDKAPASGSIVVVRRVTPRERLVDFQNASMLDEATLDLDGNQAVFLAQEALENTEDTLRRDDTDQWDAEGRRIKNVGEPIEPTDAATKAFAERTATRAEQAAVDAEQFAGSAEVHASAAQSSAAEAEASKDGAKAAEVKAEQWAENPESIEVESGKYSAKHWAKLAERMASYYLTGATPAIPLMSSGNLGYLMRVTPAGLLFTVSASVEEPETVTFVVDNRFFTLTVNDAGDLDLVEVFQPVAEVVNHVNLLADDGNIFTVTANTDGALVVKPHVGHNSLPVLSVGSGFPFEIVVEDDGTLATIRKD